MALGGRVGRSYILVGVKWKDKYNMSWTVPVQRTEKRRESRRRNGHSRIKQFDGCKIYLEKP